MSTRENAFGFFSGRPIASTNSPVLEPIGARTWMRAAINLGRFCSWMLGYFLIAIMLQILTGAYKADFSGFPDSPAHHVTSIMVSQYLREGILRSPMVFAEQYYLHYPKVAVGNWPPFYYLCAGIWG